MMVVKMAMRTAETKVVLKVELTGQKWADQMAVQRVSLRVVLMAASKGKPWVVHLVEMTAMNLVD